MVKELDTITTILLREIHEKKLAELSEETLDRLVDSEIDPQDIVNLIEMYGCNVINRIKNTIKEYLFHVQSETSNYELVHKACKIYFLGKAMPEPYRMLMTIVPLGSNEDNVNAGI